MVRGSAAVLVDRAAVLTVRRFCWTGLRLSGFRAVGCIFGELLNSSPLFPGENDIEQLCCVLRVLGTPTRESWPVRTAPHRSAEYTVSRTRTRVRTRQASGPALPKPRNRKVLVLMGSPLVCFQNQI